VIGQPNRGFFPLKYMSVDSSRTAAGCSLLKGCRKSGKVNSCVVHWSSRKDRDGRYIKGFEQTNFLFWAIWLFASQGGLVSTGYEAAIRYCWWRWRSWKGTCSPIDSGVVTFGFQQIQLQHFEYHCGEFCLSIWMSQLLFSRHSVSVLEVICLSSRRSFPHHHHN
jgi:hypothetical protein